MKKDVGLHDILARVRKGTLKVDEAAALIEQTGFEDVGFARIDHDRQSRCGFPEVIFAEGKEPQQIIAIAERILKRKDPLLITRIDRKKYLLLKKKIPAIAYNASARMAFLYRTPPKSHAGLLIGTAGTSDIPVAEEAATTCEALGYMPERLYDVGVAGIHRLMADSDKLRAAKVIIVAAGMEGALPSVVGGLVDVPVIAVPTSVGYGTSFGGIAALLSMLNSCSSGITVVNIDNGFGAAVAAVKILKLLEK
jgi:hypothetical protein